jgi:pilus assembly protein TadC
MIRDRLYRGVTKLLPKAYRRHISQQKVYAGMTIDTDAYLGSATVLAILTAAAFLFTPYAFGSKIGIKALFISIAAFCLVEFIFYIAIYFKIEDRTQRVEKVLPDALQLMASNVRAGMTPFQSLKLSARKEFGPLEEEIKLATAKALGTESFAETLLDMSKRIKSEMLDRAMKLFTTAMRSGGHLAILLEDLSDDIAENRSLRKELVTNTKTYTVFIMFTVIIGTPLLLAISIHFIEVITNLQSVATVGGTGFGLGFLAGELNISVSFLVKASYAMLVGTSLLACILLGVIVRGKPKYGLRYTPMVVIGSLAVFAALRYAVSSFFGNF